MTQSTTRSCMPSWFNWEDSRSYDSKNCVKSGYIKNLKTGATYGLVKRTDCNLRSMFAVLAIFQAPILIVGRIPLRVVRILYADFNEVGLNIAEREWLTKNSKWSQEWSAKAPTPPPAGTGSLYFQTALRSIWQLTKDIIRIVTYPLAIIALEFAALYAAFVHPIDGQKMWADVEHFWSCDRRGIQSLSEPMVFTDWCDYIAPCMQPKEVWDTRNLYRTFNRYDKNTIRSLILALEQRLILEKDFLLAEGVAVDKLQQTLKTFKQESGHMDRLSYADTNELHTNGYLKQSIAQFQTAQLLAQAISYVDELKEIRKKMMMGQISITSGQLSETQQIDTSRSIDTERYRWNRDVTSLNCFPDTLIPAPKKPQPQPTPASPEPKPADTKAADSRRLLNARSRDAIT